MKDQGWYEFIIQLICLAVKKFPIGEAAKGKEAQGQSLPGAASSIWVDKSSGFQYNDFKSNIGLEVLL